MKKNKNGKEEKIYWYSVLSVKEEVYDTNVKTSSLREIKKIISKDAWEKGLLDELKPIINEIEEGNNRFFWAFNNIEDVITSIKVIQSPYYKEYKIANNLFEYSINMLFNRFPYQPTDNLSILILEGNPVFRDPIIKMGSGAGSMAKVPSLIPKISWWRYFDLGFNNFFHIVKLEQEIGWFDRATFTNLHTSLKEHYKDNRLVEQKILLQLLRLCGRA